MKERSLIIKYSLFGLLAVIIAVADQITKIMIQKSFVTGQSVEVIKGVLNFTYVKNEGAAFGIMQGAKAAFIIITVAVFAAAFIYFKKYRPASPLFLTATAFVLSGAVGNLIDRVVLGYVRDFIDVAFMDFPVFNIADSMICIGALLIVIYAFFDLKSPERG